MTQRDALEWKVDADGDTTIVTLTGAITERAPLGALAADIAERPKIRFDLGNVYRINSSGVKVWVEFIAALPPPTETWFENCSAAIVHQINVVRGFTGRGQVTSISVPLICDRCGHMESIRIAVTRGALPDLAPVACRACKHTMELDDMAESYFAFLLR